MMILTNDSTVLRNKNKASLLNLILIVLVKKEITESAHDNRAKIYIFTTIELKLV